MPAQIVPIGAVAATGGNSGNSGNGADYALSDLAHEIMFKALDMADTADEAARALLLAVADLTHDDPTFGKAFATSSMLLDATREALDAFHNPPPPAAA